MRNLFFRCGVGAALFMLAGASAFGCQPCETAWGLKESLAAAELVVVARKTDFSYRPVGPEVEPQCAEFEVAEVLKGEAGRKKIMARAWYGMCPYGVVVNSREPHLLILRRLSGRGEYSESVADECVRIFERERLMYGPVNFGCAVVSRPVKAGGVEVDGVSVTLEELREEYGLKGSGGGAAGGEPEPGELSLFDPFAPAGGLFRAARLFSVR